jgi:hypothetical protein
VKALARVIASALIVLAVGSLPNVWRDEAPAFGQSTPAIGTIASASSPLSARVGTGFVWIHSHLGRAEQRGFSQFGLAPSKVRPPLPGVTGTAWQATTPARELIARGPSPARGPPVLPSR